MALTQVEISGVSQTGNNNVFAQTGPFKNRIINGDMRIDQRNAGASVTVNVNTDVYSVDRFLSAGQSSDGVFTVQRSATAPAGFTNSLLATVTTADASIGAAQYYFIAHKIEGFNCADLNFGTASASTVTLSFWVRSSLTGTFGGALANGGYTRSYPFTYTINAANTFEYKTITIQGDSSGTWLTDNGIGLRIYWDLGTGTDNRATAGAWTGSGRIGATGSTNWIGTNGATFYITGVQLEVGSTATPFERRSYGQELALCQRYYQKSYEIGTVPGTSTFTNAVNTFGTAAASTAGTIGATAYFRVEMRTTATKSIWDTSGNAGKVTANPYGSSVVTNNSGTVVSTASNLITVERSSGTNCNGIIYHYTASAEL